MPRLVLASASPRRLELLRGVGIEPLVRPVEVDESPRDGEAAGDYVLRLAEAKCLAAGRRPELVLAADTTVALGSDLLGKPADAAHARQMLARLAGRVHRVVTGIALWDVGRDLRVAAADATLVRLASLTGEEIDRYVASGEPLDKAGAYAIQGRGALFVESIRGNYTNVVGLPLPLLYRLLQRIAPGVLDDRWADGAEGRLNRRT